MSGQNTFEVILSELGRLILPLKEAISSKENFYSFMLKLGWDPDDIPQPLKDLGSGIDTLAEKLQVIIGAAISMSGSIDSSAPSVSGSFSLSDVDDLKNAIEQIINGIKEIESAPDSVIPAKLRDDSFREKFPLQLLSYLIITYLTRFHPTVAFFLRAFGVIKLKYVPKTGSRKPYIEYTIDFSDLPKIFQDPTIVFKNAFGWGSDDFNFSEFLFQLENLFHAVGVDVFVEQLDTSVAKHLEGGVAINDNSMRKALRAVFFERARDTGRLAAEVRLLGLPGDGGTTKPGIAIVPDFNGVLDFKMQLGPDIAVTIKSEIDLQGGVGLVIRPDKPIEFITGFNKSDTISHATGNLEVKAERSNADNSPIIIFGSADSTRLEFKKAGGKGGVTLSTSTGADVYVEFELDGIKFVFKPDEGDGFIKNLVPPDGFELDFEIAVGYSVKRGFYFRGSSAFEINLPAHIQIGPVSLDGMTITIKPDNGKLPVIIGANISAALGPINASVQNMGLSVAFSFPPGGGNLGPLDLQLGFKPPNGVGLSVDAGVIKGGGFLYLDYDKGEYTGALELEFQDMFSLKAIGIINTKMPDGSKGFSLLIIITADFTPIQLGFGFTLNGVGGLLGLNRTIKVDVLREGVKTNAIKSVLFPENIIANINRIISDLKQIFPIQQDHFVVGPMAEIGWASIVTLELGLLIELPEPRIIILGVLKAILPDEDTAILKLQVNFLGVIDFGNKYISFDASLYDSHLLTFTLTGDMALRISWGDNALFILSVGGFHPAFHDAPQDLQHMTRLTLSLLSGDNPRLTIQAYFAVTSNTIQFGAKLELYAAAAGFNIWGYLGFDVLFQFDPFKFIADIYAGLALRMDTTVIMGITLSGTLAGPTPWDVQGDASFTILFFTISIGFHVTWGDSADKVEPAKVNILLLLEATVSDARNWKADIPATNNLHVTVKQIQQTGDEIIIHPFGVLSFNETLVPLDFTINKFGDKVPDGANSFTMSEIKSGTLALTTEVRKDRFAPANFIELSDSDKLARKSFENMNSGFTITASNTLNTAATVEIEVDYELSYLRKKRFSFVLAKGLYKYAKNMFQTVIKSSAVSQSKLSYSNNRQSVNAPDTVSVGTENYAVANVSNMKLYQNDMLAGSQAEAYMMYNDLIKTKPEMKNKVQVVSTFELNQT